MANLDINVGKLKKNAFRYSKVRGETASRIRIPGGVIDAKSMGKVVEIAEKYGTGVINITNRQGIEIPGIKLTDVDKVNAEVQEIIDSLSINSIKGRLFGEMADPNSFKGIEETVADFNDFAGRLCGSFSSVCGAFAEASFESIGAAAGAGHGGGGQDTGGWAGKNDDDEKRKPFILGHIPTRKSGRGGNHR